MRAKEKIGLLGIFMSQYLGFQKALSMLSSTPQPSAMCRVIKDDSFRGIPIEELAKSQILRRRCILFFVENSLAKTNIKTL